MLLFPGILVTGVSSKLSLAIPLPVILWYIVQLVGIQ